MSGETVSQTPDQRPQKTAAELERLHDRWTNMGQKGPNPYEIFDEIPEDEAPFYKAKSQDVSYASEPMPMPAYRAVDIGGRVVAEEVNGEVEIPGDSTLTDTPQDAASAIYDGYIPEELDKAA